MATTQPKSQATLERMENLARVARSVAAHAPAPIERRVERLLLKRQWAKSSARGLQSYLVVGYQSPIINAQSILARHHFTREVFGDDRFAELMQQELDWSAERNQQLRGRQRELTEAYGEFRKAKTAGAWRAAYDEVMVDRRRFAPLWREALQQDRPGARLGVIEAACGSANDFRFIKRYGLARHLRYTGFDLTQTNIDNAKRMFPRADFRLGDVQNVAAGDQSYEWAVAHDLLEHLAPHAFERAIEELCRVTSRGVVVSFFHMSDIPEHRINPRRTYHVNMLSKRRIEESFLHHCREVSTVQIQTMPGFEDNYNRNAWTLIARH